MPTTIAGLPHWEITFDSDGHPDPAQRKALLADVAAAGVTDLIVFSHGWNNSISDARQLYEAFFTLIPSLMAADAPASAGPARVVGTAGVFWPSMRWSDEPIPAFPAVASGGGAASFGGGTVRGGEDADAATAAALKVVYSHQDQHEAIDRLFELLEQRPDDPAKLAEFHALMKKLSPAASAASPEDAGGAGMVDEKPTQLFSRFADGLDAIDPFATGGGSAGGAAGLGSAFGRLWDGAKEALRQVTYWKMKARAGKVGSKGLGPMIAALHGAAPELRVHLVGHSFGGRLVAFSLTGLPDDLDPSPVASLTLLQGAFSHFAFADHLPAPLHGPGGLNGRQHRVAGPLVSCFSSHDSALGVLYPLAALAALDNAAGLSDAAYPWGAMGHDGAQNLNAPTVPVKPAGSVYSFNAGVFTNVDCAKVVKAGGPPAGAHSDIVHPELAWVVLTAAGLVGR